MIVSIKHIGCCRLQKLRWTFRASLSCLHCLADEQLAFSPWTQPRKGNQGWWSDGEVISNLWPLNPMSPPQFHYVCLQLYSNCRFGRLPLQMSPGHLFMRQTKPMIQLFLQSPAKQGIVMKSVFGNAAGIRNIFGIGCYYTTLGYNHPRRTGSWESSTVQRTESPGEHSMLVLPFAEAVLHYLCRWRTEALSFQEGAGWMLHPALTEANTNILWEPLYEVIVAETSMWSEVGWNWRWVNWDQLLVLLLRRRSHAHPCMHAQSLQSCLTLCDSMDCSPPCSCVHGILQARILQWVAMPSSRGSSPPRDWTHVSCNSSIAGGLFTADPWGKPHAYPYLLVTSFLSSVCNFFF